MRTERTLVTDVVCWCRARRRALLVAASTLAFAASAVAQRAPAPPKPKEPPKDGQEFTKQGLLITNFTPRPGADMKFARKAADAVRSRVGRFVNKREVDVLDGDDIAYRMERAGYNPDTVLDLRDIRAVGKYLRADEFVVASVANGPSGARISGQLVLFRDERLRQPLPEVSAPKLDSAALLFARSIGAARSQLIYERRCENALRDGSAARAVSAARQGIAAFEQGAIARTCLVWALRQNKTSVSTILTEANAVLAIDSMNAHALEAAAVSLDSLGRRDEAGLRWLRLAATDTGDLDLAVRVAYALVDGGNAPRAEPFIVAESKAHPDDIRLMQLKWRAGYENKHWPLAIEAGETLLERDPVAQHDSVFFYRLAFVYHAASQPFKAIETVAHGMTTFPKDSRLYSLYTQYVKAEADTVVPRGLAMFPGNADLLALNAKELRARGKIAESLEATKQAAALDSSMAGAQMSIAQLEFELGQPDSAIAALRVGLARGDDSALVAQFALSKGNALYRTAMGTKTSTDFSLALRMLAFSDSVKSTDLAKFLTGTVALGLAQATLTDATKLTDKAASCRLARMAIDLFPLARAGLHAGEATTYADPAKQSLEYLDQQLEPIAGQQTKAVCEN